MIGDIELFARHAQAPIVAVTGSNGKSTVVTMVSDILRGAGLNVRTGGNLGTPALDLLGDDPPDYYVLEVSSFQLESTVSLAPAVACIVNVSPDHMDRYADMDAYFAAKKRIYERASALVLNADDDALRDLRPPCNTEYFSPNAELNARYRLARDGGELWLAVDGEKALRTTDLALRGTHNYANALTAMAIADQLAVPRPIQIRALRAYRGLPHRCQLVLTREGVDWIDDSKGTNVGATCAAIHGVFSDRHGVLIAGGQGKGADFSALTEAVDGRVHDVVLIGEDARAIAEVLEGRVSVHFATSMQAAVASAAILARSGEAVLLSPACASFDMFEGFEARGRAFAAAVKEVVRA